MLPVVEFHCACDVLKLAVCLKQAGLIQFRSFMFCSNFSSPLQLSREEVERRRVRRERNKLAAAKCRNRRRELTDSLQTVSDL